MPRRRVRDLLWLPAFWILAGCDVTENASVPVPKVAPQTQAVPQKIEPRFLPVDLEPWANAPMPDPGALPIGAQRISGVDYQMTAKPLQLGSASFSQFPLNIEGITIGQTCRAIHFLHASQGGAYQQPGHPKHEADGVQVGAYLIHYEDGTQAEQPLLYGQHLRDWWDWDNNALATECQIIWTGETAGSGQYGRKTRLYWAVWENPHPEKSIATVGLISSNAKAAPFCVAMTLETK